MSSLKKIIPGSGFEKILQSVKQKHNPAYVVRLHEGKDVHIPDSYANFIEIALQMQIKFVYIACKYFHAV